MVRDEGTCRRAARNGLQDRCLHFEIAALVEEVAHGLHDAGTLDEGLAHVGVDDQIDVTLTVAHFGVGQRIECLAVLLLDNGQRAHRLRYDREAAAVHRQLAGVGQKGEALHTDEVAYVEQLFEYRVVERRIPLGAYVVAADIYLYASGRILQLEERGRTHYAAAHYAACHRYVLVVAFFGREIFGYLTRRGRNFIALRGIGVDAQLAQRGQRCTSQLFLFAQFQAHSMFVLNYY